MGQTYNNNKGRFISRLAAGFTYESVTGERGKGTSQEGSLADTIEFFGQDQVIDVRRNYRWSMSSLTPEDLNEVPYIRLQEFKCTTTSIKKQFDLYSALIPESLGDAVNNKTLNVVDHSLLSPYENIWPHDEPSGLSYIFPYFNKVGFELASEPWSALDSIGDSIKNITGGIGDLFKGGKKVADAVQKGIDLVQAGTNTALNMKYPAVGVTDRPKIFMAHNDRNINISITLYNTYSTDDWADNRDLCYTLMSQNLFNKRDLITGVPPVFYSILIPGQYFCWAASMTNIKVEHLGNQRLIYGDDTSASGYIIPDAYQIDLTLTELVKPSKNQFEAITNGDGYKQVTVTKK